MATLEVLLLTFCLIFLVLILMRWDQVLTARKANRDRTNEREPPT